MIYTMILVYICRSSWCCLQGCCSVGLGVLTVLIWAVMITGISVQVLGSLQGPHVDMQLLPILIQAFQEHLAWHLC